jgi:hypothetical protein
MDGKGKPNWANQERAVELKEGKLKILGFQELDGDAKISSGYRLSDNVARGELSKMIKTQFSGILQNLEEGVDGSGNLSRYYSSEVSKTMIHDLQISSRYWEKVQTFNNDGETLIKLRVYSLAEIPELKFKKLLRETLEKEKAGPEVKAQVLEHFESEIKKFQSY